jgi:CBS domain-containing protein
MSTVAQILRTKSSNAVHRTAPDSTVYEAIAAMAEHGIGALLVTEGERIVGIVTERDYARKIVLAGRSSKETPVADVMTPEVLVVSPQQTTEECMALMTENRLRHLPVLDNGRLVGLVSIGDLVKDIISEQRFIIEQLEHYVTGSR